MGWALYTTVITQYTMVHWYSHIVRFASRVLINPSKRRFERAFGESRR